MGRKLLHVRRIVNRWSAQQLVERGGDARSVITVVCVNSTDAETDGKTPEELIGGEWSDGVSRRIVEEVLPGRGTGRVRAKNMSSDIHSQRNILQLPFRQTPQRLFDERWIAENAAAFRIVFRKDQMTLADHMPNHSTIKQFGPT